jgi:hypothetical protein
MNLALDHLADNPIIDELLCWAPRTRRIKSVRACSTMFRKPFIEVECEDGEVFHRHFARDSFAGYWAEAWVILAYHDRIDIRFRFQAGRRTRETGAAGIADP